MVPSGSSRAIGAVSAGGHPGVRALLCAAWQTKVFYWFLGFKLNCKYHSFQSQHIHQKGEASMSALQSLANVVLQTELPFPISKHSHCTPEFRKTQRKRPEWAPAPWRAVVMGEEGSVKAPGCFQAGTSQWPCLALKSLGPVYMLSSLSVGW